MKTGWHFRPTPVNTVLTISAIIIFLGLGQWQIIRAGQKQQLQDDYLFAQSQPAYDLALPYPSGMVKNDLAWRNVIVTGKYNTNRIYLLDNQVKNGVVGYHVVTPFEVDGIEAAVLVNRGWVAAGKNRDEILPIDTPPGPLTLSGRVHYPEDNPFIENGFYEQLESGIVRIQEINLDDIALTLNEEILPFLILLDPGADSGFYRQWSVPGTDDVRHLGYAFQWLLMALALAIIFISTNIKTNGNDDG